MAAIEAQHLNVAYVAVAKSLGLPTQAYMALSDGKSLDAQAGGETFSSALLAAIAGVNSVSGPGMLDFVLTFSLPKLVFDNEVCGQCLHFVRDMNVIEDLPAQQLVADLLANDHLITSPHTLSHWPQELYLTNPVIDRENRETWEKAGAKDLYQRTCDEVENAPAVVHADRDRCGCRRGNAPHDRGRHDGRGAVAGVAAAAGRRSARDDAGAAAEPAARELIPAR